MADKVEDEENSFRLKEDEDREFDSGVSREVLVRDELSGSVSILQPNSFTPEKNKQQKRSFYILISVIAFVLLIGVILLIVGLVLLSRAPKCKTSDDVEAYRSLCLPSSEAKAQGLYNFLEKVQNFYYDSFPNKIVYKKPKSVETIRQKFKIYDESPAAKKTFTDKSMELLKEVKEMKIDRSKLTQRESKALSQVEHVLKYGLQYIYAANYYAGDYMLIPNLYCDSYPICDIGNDLAEALRYFKPDTVEDLEMLRDRLKTVQRAFVQYIENLKYGVKAGMVPGDEACKAGINGLTSKYKNISFHGEQGVFQESYMKDILDQDFLARLTNNSVEMDKWNKKYNKSVNDSLHEFILEHVGKPINELFRYIREEYLQHCVPSHISSGLASLPLSYVYTNGTADTTNLTTKTLPTGEVLDGKKTYARLVGGFTTNDMTPDEIYDLGVKMLNKLYPEAVELSRQVTGNQDNKTAIRLFLEKLEVPEMYYYNGSLPANESDENAYKLCSNEQDARKHCPVRWEAIKRWGEDAAMFNSLLDPKTVDMFHFTGPKYSVPNCPIAVVPSFNPSAGIYYGLSDSMCHKPSKFYLPFFRKNIGPKWELLSTCVHEGRPGHHTQIQGYLERFSDVCGDAITWLDGLQFFNAFIEGWALYAENPLVARETDIYDKRPLDKYGLIKWQIWRALRLIVDTGLHYKGMSLDQAKEYFTKYAWDEGTMADKELTRYQSYFGQATTYMIGQQHILKLRKYAERELGPKEFKLKDFHYHLLSQGSSPLSHLDEVVKRYVSCTKNSKQTGCDVMLNPPLRPEGAGDEQNVEQHRRIYF